MKLEETLRNNTLKEKPRMDQCRVFKVDVGMTPNEQIPSIMANVKASFAQDFDIRYVVFVPVRGNGSDTGWQ